MWISGGEPTLYAWPYCERTQMWEGGKRRAKDGDVNRNNKEPKHLKSNKKEGEIQEM